MSVFDAQSELCGQNAPSPEPPNGTAVLRERLALAQRLHDTLCQNVSALQLLVGVAEKKAIRECPALADDFGELKIVVNKINGEVQQLVTSLRSSPGDQPGH